MADDITWKATHHYLDEYVEALHEEIHKLEARLAEHEQPMEKAMSVQSTGMAIRAKETAVLVQMSPDDLQRVRDFGLQVAGTWVTFAIPMPEAVDID